jgi:hypothetical protein
VRGVALVAAAFFGGNLEASRSFLDEYGYIEKASSKSRFDRRLHAIDSSPWRTLFGLVAPKSSSTTMPLTELRGGLLSGRGSKRPMPAWEEVLGKPIRRYIETVFSNLSAMFSRKVHAVRPKGFESKIVWFLLAFSVQCL